MSALRKFVIFLAILVITIPLAFFGVIYSKLKSMQVDNKGLEMLASNDHKHKEDIVNILLIGSDARPGEDISRSDSMMILTVDNKHKKLRLTSLGRDTYVKIPGHGFQKLTHAFAYGKEKLLIETIENNFKLDIQNYAKVDFMSFMGIIDVLGGVTVKVTQNEIPELNKFLPECYNWDKNPNKGPIKFIKKPGTFKLNAYQALSFSRIRKNDGTMERDDRQRQVIEAIIAEVSHLSITKYPKLLNAILPYVKTNMSPTDILSLGKDILSMGDLHITAQQFPLHPEYEIRLPESGYVIPFENYEVDMIHRFIFDGTVPTEAMIKEETKKWRESGQQSQYSSNPEYMNAMRMRGY